MARIRANTLPKAPARRVGKADVRLDFNAMLPDVVGRAGIAPAEIALLRPRLEEAHRAIVERTGAGKDFLGFLDLPFQPDEAVDRVQRTADRLAELGDRHVVLGIGGSYLGARAILDALANPYRNEQTRAERNGRPRIYYEGNNLDPDALRSLLDLLPSSRATTRSVEGDFTVNVISKSGTTLETAVGFRMLRQRLAQVYGRDYARRIVATTDAARGLLHDQAAKEGYETFVIPDDVGGRFSVMTPVGLLPAAIAGIDIKSLIAGARAMAERCSTTAISRNPALMYAALQHLSYRAGRGVSVMMSWGKALEGLAMWYDQLCAESLGKQDVGRIPLASVGTRDLHSRGQELQQGPRNTVVTHLVVDRYPGDQVVCWDAEDRDKLNYVAGKTVGQMLQGAQEATQYAYSRDRRPSMTLRFPELSAYTLGQAFYMLELATVAEGYLLGINPLDQPGVEDYKKFMFALLGRSDMATWKREFDARPKGDPAYIV
ncbi:MAG: glucose-6-phosphate isomerase [Candidatus Sericytochromatia bacterium]|uniref:Glucose-6-phosphate isomerase n=1 Tax=Candidatus Tanganyikabacteria bacterium TaxID=2961651 RepID=A0A937X4D8_9BACT|nr:glucose-6-phosphate isomerase [Candidatus Tanganyikabacteria bacterium]